MTANVASVVDLAVEIDASGVSIISEVSFSLAPGEVLAVVGETASGKSTAATALLGYQRRGARVTGGEVDVSGTDVRTVGDRGMRRLRGGTVSYVPQDPGSGLNPALRLGTQLREVLDEHDFGAPAERGARVAELLEEVSLPTDPQFLHRYPHELSGGQQQRVLLAMAFACRPEVIVLDEPTTGLDVTTQAHILRTVKDLTRIHRVAALYVTHDLSVVANLADRIAVLYAGRVVEMGASREIFTAAQHPYTRKLIAACPTIGGDGDLEGIHGRAPRPGQRPSGCVFADRCELAEDRCRQEMPPPSVAGEGHTVRCWRAGEDVANDPALHHITSREAAAWRPTDEGKLEVTDLRVSYGATEVLHGVNLEVTRGECVALVGESGSGKTTLARAIAGLHGSHISGVLRYADQPLLNSARERDVELRRAIQHVFQNPYSALHPRKRIGASLEQPLKALFDLPRDQRRARVAEVAHLVSLDESVLRTYPDQLSGGERQRVAIARALTAQPSLLICDEVTSALDVSVQASIMQLLKELKKSIGLGLIFVTHNLALVRSIADQVAVMRLGEIVEFGVTDEVLTRPADPYTARLLADTPVIPADLVTARRW